MYETIQGNGIVEKYIQKFDAKFYMIKHNGYYGFFLISPKGTYICAGGRLKKIDKSFDLKRLNDEFLNMVGKYLYILFPYRSAQEKLFNAVKDFGGKGTIHGCIIDIDFCNHIMLNPIDGSISYYYSPEFGIIELYDDILTLLEKHNPELAVQYEEALQHANGQLMPQLTYTGSNAIQKIDIKNSVYTISNRINQLQRLFDKKILRDWNNDLLSRKDVGSMIICNKVPGQPLTPTQEAILDAMKDRPVEPDEDCLEITPE